MADDDERDIRALRDLVKRAGSQRQAAAVLGISEAHVSDMLYRRRKITGGTLAKLGLRRVTRYERIA